MASKEKIQRDKKMAADLKDRGIWHGRRLTKSNVEDPTKPGYIQTVGSTKLRRRRK